MIIIIRTHQIALSNRFYWSIKNEMKRKEKKTYLKLWIFDWNCLETRNIMDLSVLTSIVRMTNDSVAANPSVNQLLNNSSYVDHAPQFTRAALMRVHVLVILGIISLVGNVAILFHIAKTRKTRRNSRHTWSAIYTLILHLSIADLIVTIFCIFGEAAWSYTVQWIAGKLACKLVKWFQMFSLYLSTYVLVLIGIDRWVAVKYPMKSLNMAKRCHRLLIFSYFLSFIMSMPQVSVSLSLLYNFDFLPFFYTSPVCILFHSAVDWSDLFFSLIIAMQYLVRIIRNSRYLHVITCFA